MYGSQGVLVLEMLMDKLSVARNYFIVLWEHFICS